MSEVKKVVLAYSDGLDTSIIIPWLKEHYNNCEVIAVCGNVGQKGELEGLEERAKASGASKLYIEDLTDEFVEDYVIPTMQAGADYEGYLLGTSFARPILAKRVVEIARAEGADAVCHGSTGKGSCRSWGGFNLFAALENCKDLLLGFGGHELAAGFTIDRDNIPAFRDRMNEYARSYCGGQQPESALEIDVAIAHPAAVTLEELEALSVLEPYGSGNARPLFCLLGATLLRTQNVGQNRHLKLRLGKGCAQFDGIFFSTVAERCGCHPGDRVDAAFYLQINEFRGSRTVQLQMVDIRPSLCASGREQEALTLAHRCAAGKAVSLREARRALPTREPFAAAWRFLDRTVPEDGLTTDRLPLLRLMAAELSGAEPVLRAAMCAAVFRERGLLDWQLNGDAITLHLRRGQHVALDQSPLMNTLQNDNEKGGGAL